MKESKAKRILLFVCQMAAAALLVGADQLIKQAVTENLKGTSGKVLIKGVLGLTYAENTGAAFSMFSSSTLLLSIVTIALLLGLVIALMLGKIKGIAPNIAVPMIIAGGTGNLIDRLVSHYVVDYIETLFVNFPIYNYADMLVTIGVAIIIIYLIYEMIKEKKSEKDNPKTDENTENGNS